MQNMKLAPNHRELQAGFLDILPRIRLHAATHFRNLRCPHRRQDAVAEVIALTWKWYVRLAHAGKDARRFPSALAAYAAKAVKSGRRVCGQEKSKDALSPLAQQRHGFAVSTLPDVSTLSTNPIAEALRDNTQSPVEDQVAFRIDFASWLSAWDRRRRDIILDMAQGERTEDLAARYKVCPARISQMRQEFHHAWEKFHGEA